MAGVTGVLWKPDFDGVGDGGLVLERPANLVQIVGPDGKVIQSSKPGSKGHEGYKVVFSKPWLIPPGSRVVIDGKDSFTITAPSKRMEFNYGTDTPRKVGGKGDVVGSAPGAYGGYPAGQAPIQNMGDASAFVSAPVYSDPNQLQIGNVTPGTIPNQRLSIEDINTYIKQNFTSLLETYRSSLEATKELFPQMQGVNEEAISRANRFNQSQLDAAFGKFPEIQKSIKQDLQQADSFMRGKIPDPVLQSALETSINSQASDVSKFLGGGANSGSAGKTNQMLSAQEALKLNERGQQIRNTALANAERLIAKPQMYTADPDKLMATIQSQSGLDTKDVINTIQQNQELNANIDTRNVTNDINAQTTNIANQYKVLQDKINLDLSNQLQIQTADQAARNLFLQSLQQQYERGLAVQDRDYLAGIVRDERNTLQNRQNIAAAIGLLGMLGDRNSGLSQAISSIMGKSPQQTGGASGSQQGTSLSGLEAIMQGLGSLGSYFGLGSSSTPTTDALPSPTTVGTTQSIGSWYGDQSFGSLLGDLGSSNSIISNTSPSMGGLGGLDVQPSAGADIGLGGYSSGYDGGLSDLSYNPSFDY